MATDSRTINQVGIIPVLDIYFQYSALSLSSLKNLLALIERADLAVLEYFKKWNEQNEDFSYIETDTIQNVLVEEIHTGQSIRLKFSNKKGFQIKSKKNEIVIRVSAAVGSCLVVGWLLLSGYKSLLETRKLQLENRNLELQNKKTQMELDAMLQKQESEMQQDPFLNFFHKDLADTSSVLYLKERTLVVNSVEMLQKFLQNHQYFSRVEVDKTPIRKR